MISICFCLNALERNRQKFFCLQSFYVTRLLLYVLEHSEFKQTAFNKKIEWFAFSASFRIMLVYVFWIQRILFVRQR